MTLARGARYALCGLGGPGQVLLRGMIGRGRFAVSQNEEAPKDGGHSGASPGPFGGTYDGEGLPITASEITLRCIESICWWCSAKS